MNQSKGKNWKKVNKINLQNLGLLTIKRSNMSENVEKWVLDDGRRVEKVVSENKSGDEVERVTEVRVDEERPQHTQQKIIEKIKPVVYERITQDIDIKTGAVVNEKVETINIELNAPKEQKDDSFVTRQEMVEAIVKALQSSKSIKPVSVKKEAKSGLKSLGIADEIEKLKPKQLSYKDMILIGIVAIQIIGLIYLIVF